MVKIKFLTLLILITSSILLGCSKNEKEEINISVASSLKDAMIEIKSEYESLNNDVELVINYGSSGTLKQQIEQGAPCDIFVSAGIEQVEELDEKGLLNSDSIGKLLKNELVLIAPKDSNIEEIKDINLKDIKQIGMGYPDSVPVGKYTEETIKNSGVKEEIEEKLIYAKDVKEVLAWVQSGNVDLGFVYLTDTFNNEKVKIIHEIDDKYHSEIIYPISIVGKSENSSNIDEFYNYLKSDEGITIFETYGYKN